MKNALVLAGYFGFDNAGDELIARAVRDCFPGPWIVPSVAERSSLQAMARHFEGAKRLVYGGGELFQARTSLKSFLYYAALPALARARGARFTAYGQGLDPDLPRWARRAAALSLNMADRVWARDEASADLLRGAGLGRPLSVAPDPVWALEAPALPPVSSPRKILWIPRDPAELDSQREMAQWIARKTGVPPTILFLHPSRDAARYGSLTPCRDWKDKDSLFQLLADHDAVVSMRYHGLLLGALFGRPVVAMAAHGKVSALARELGTPCLLPEDGGEVVWESLAEAVRASAAVVSKVKALTLRAREGLAALADHLGET